MARIAVGDVQGCHDELRALLRTARFSADRDQLWFVGDLVNRGPDSLGVLRFVRALDANAQVVLGNHDLHLLAVARGAGGRRLRKDDTLDEVLAAPDRDALLDWLQTRPLAVRAPTRGGGPAGGRDDLMVHAGVPPQWSVDDTLRIAAEVERALRDDAAGLFAAMYGDQPDRWDPALAGHDRLRFAINALTRMRFVDRDGVVDLKMKGAPDAAPRGWYPWFDAPGRRSAASRIIMGHWSTLGLVVRDDLIALDTGCVWGGALTAVSLDDPEGRWQVACDGHRAPG
ncbi:MAG: symmetrical bis(5'-nucleosyl)-tetraphosphatase [Gammaproteobacteria bacterium]|nr:symmetrical bis(5'-nucleosyl)-tetraphosphatase [Gammaproteobacteria bacterium]